MRLSALNENDDVLLVGEGNFSFAVALAKYNLKISLTATAYESVMANETGKKNIQYLRDNGIRVSLGVDATKLDKHPVLKLELFDKIVFNFPHAGGKMRIDKNRDLLRNFFQSIGKSLKANGHVLVTLCNGQGGTPVDSPQRRYDDSWKIVEMAAHGDFMLTAVESFESALYPDYLSTGYRSLEKEFNTSGSLTHFFEKVESPNRINIAPHGKVDISSITEDMTWKDVISSIEKEIRTKSDSLYPCIFTFDITFSVCHDFDTSKFYSTLYNFAGCIVHDVEFIGSYKFPDTDRTTRTYRISYKSLNLPLYRKRVVQIHCGVIADILEDNLNVSVTR